MGEVKTNDIVILPTQAEIDEFCRGASEVGFLSYNINYVVQAGIWAAGDQDKIQAATADILELFRAEDMPSTQGHVEFLAALIQSFYTSLWNRMLTCGVASETDVPENPRYESLGVDGRHCVILKKRSHHEGHHHRSAAAQAAY